MKRIVSFTFLLLVSSALASAQDKPASANPLSDALRDSLIRYTKNITAAADALPADKYSFKPTADQNTFAHLAIHISDSNYLFCSKLSGVTPPDHPKLAESDGKDKIVAAIRSSFEFCSSSLAKVDDSRLSESVALFPNRSVSRATVFLALAGSWADHYGAEAMYLRLNGVFPPTAQPPKPN